MITKYKIFENSDIDKFEYGDSVLVLMYINQTLVNKKGVVIGKSDDGKYLVTIDGINNEHGGNYVYDIWSEKKLYSKGNGRNCMWVRSNNMVLINRTLIKSKFNHKFKIGDRVKIVNFEDYTVGDYLVRDIIGESGTVTGIDTEKAWGSLYTIEFENPNVNKILIKMGSLDTVFIDDELELDSEEKKGDSTGNDISSMIEIVLWPSGEIVGIDFDMFPHVREYFDFDLKRSKKYNSWMLDDNQKLLLLNFLKTNQ